MEQPGARRGGGGKEQTRGGGGTPAPKPSKTLGSEREVKEGGGRRGERGKGGALDSA